MNSPTLRFALVFALLFLLLASAFEAVRGTPAEESAVRAVLLQPTATLIDTLTPQERVVVIGRTLKCAQGPSLRVTRGCDGIEMLLLLTAAVLAYPAAWRRRVAGLLLGLPLAGVLAVLRLLVLHYTLRYSPGAWNALHGLVLPLSPVLLLTAYFLRWTNRALITSDLPHVAAP